MTTWNTELMTQFIIWKSIWSTQTLFTPHQAACHRNTGEEKEEDRGEKQLEAELKDILSIVCNSYDDDTLKTCQSGDCYGEQGWASIQISRIESNPILKIQNYLDLIQYQFGLGFGFRYLNYRILVLYRPSTANGWRITCNAHPNCSLKLTFYIFLDWGPLKPSFSTAE